MSARRRSWWFGLCILVVAPAVGAEALDPTSALAQLAPPTEAVVYLVPPTLLFFAPADERAMRQAACRYATQDPAAVAALVDLVRRAKPQSTPRVDRPDLRAGVSFIAAEGATLDLMLDRSAPGFAAAGVLRQAGAGEIRSIDVSLAPSLVSDLRAWARTFGGSRDGIACRAPS